MKRILILLFAVTTLLCCCGEKSPNTFDDNNVPKDTVNDPNPAVVEKEPVNTGNSVIQAFDSCTISLTIPKNWNSLTISESDIFELQHIGIQLFDSEIPEQREMYDGKLFVAITASGFAKTYVDSWAEIGKDFIEKTYTTKTGYVMKVYYVDGLPEYATFDDYSDMCVFFDLSENDELDEIFGIIDGIEFCKTE